MLSDESCESIIPKNQGKQIHPETSFSCKTGRSMCKNHSLLSLLPSSAVCTAKMNMCTHWERKPTARIIQNGQQRTSFMVLCRFCGFLWIFTLGAPHAYHPITWETEAGGSGAWGQPGLHSKTVTETQKIKTIYFFLCALGRPSSLASLHFISWDISFSGAQKHPLNSSGGFRGQFPHWMSASISRGKTPGPHPQLLHPRWSGWSQGT